MDLEQWVSDLEHLKRAPTDRWDPKYCGAIPLKIAADGTWYYQDSAITRERLVKLLASVLVFENDQYYLVTPAEKVSIVVEDVPFLITEWKKEVVDNNKVIVVNTNLGESFAINHKNPIELRDNLPYVNTGANLLARVHRNVYYQWVDETHSVDVDGRTALALESAGKSFVIGYL